MTDDARAVILGRIRTGLADRPRPAPVERTYRVAGSTTATQAELVELLAHRLRDYGAGVDVTTADRVGDTIAAALAARGAGTVIVPSGFPEPLLTGIAADVLGDMPPLTTDALDGADAVLTTCAYAIAETGTIVLDHGPGQGRRALTLVPDYHLVVLRPEQVLAQVPDAVAVLDATSTQTWISGPSATSDIELSRVEGVHGPRTLHVIIG